MAIHPYNYHTFWLFDVLLAALGIDIIVIFVDQIRHFNQSKAFGL